jgi:hypothetical protein
MPGTTRLLLYLCSPRNIVACALALLGPALLFLGVIHQGWLLITAGLYAAGYLLTPAPREIATDLAQSLPFETLLAQLDRIIREIRPQLQPELLQHLDSIRSSIEEVRPRLAAVTGGADELYTVRETVARYLPETLASYMKLPSLFRVTHVIEDGKTARALLSEQLTVLDEQMKEVVANVARADADALLANGRFLEARFRRRDLLLP